MQVKIKKCLVLAILLCPLQLFEPGRCDSDLSTTKRSEERVLDGEKVVQVEEEQQEADDGKQQGEERHVGRDE